MRLEPLACEDPNPEEEIQRVVALVPGDDAADRLARLTSLVGWGGAVCEGPDFGGTAHDVTGHDVAAAAALGGTIKVVACASRDGTDIRAFLGPAFIDGAQPLASLDQQSNGVQIDGRRVSSLHFFREAARPRLFEGPAPQRTLACAPAVSGWFVRLSFPGLVPGDDAVRRLAFNAGLLTEQIVQVDSSPSQRWLLAAPQCRSGIDHANATLMARHRIHVAAFRRISA
jgi:hypothetical protein